MSACFCLQALEHYQKSGQNSIRDSARRYGVPFGVLRRRVSGALTVDSHVGRCPVLGAELEQRLLNHVTALCKRGFGLSVQNLQLFAKCFARDLESFKASDEWAHSFMSRHGLSRRVRRPDESECSAPHYRNVCRLRRSMTAFVLEHGMRAFSLSSLLDLRPR
jgi:hypothetical protein